MTVSRATIKLLNNLCGALYLEYPKDHYDPKIHRAERWQVKPIDIEEGDEGVHLYGKYYGLYREAFAALRKELALEFLRDKELDRELWHLTCEIILQRSSFSNFGAVKKRITEFVSVIVEPILEYEILVPLLNIDLGEKVIQIGDSNIRTYDERMLIEWGITEKLSSPSIFERFLNKSCFLIRENGNNETRVCNRAREKAYYLSKILQVALSSSGVLLDEQLLYELGSEVAIRLFDRPENVGFNWIRRFSAIPLVIDDKLEGDVDSFLGTFASIFNDSKLSLDLKKSYRNAITWLGRSLEEENLDIKIVFLSTALESILSSSSEDRKGEPIAYRMMLLNTYLEDSFVHPSKILYLYELRSKIIHGSELSVATKNDYITMRHVTRETLKNAIQAINKMKLKRKIDFHRQLESNRLEVEQIMDWLKVQGDQRSKQIYDYMRSNLC